jgi:hypothetical protein
MGFGLNIKVWGELLFSMFSRQVNAILETAINLDCFQFVITMK